jgi:hypothetical protein
MLVYLKKRWDLKVGLHCLRSFIVEYALLEFPTTIWCELMPTLFFFVKCTGSACKLRMSRECFILKGGGSDGQTLVCKGARQGRR